MAGKKSPARLGRASLALRPLKFRKSVNRYAEGSCLVEMGHTQVLCLATVEEKLPKWREASQQGWVTAEYAMLPRATHTRSERESVKGKISGRSQEISRLVGRALRSVVDFQALGPRVIAIDCEVLQADGGTRCAAINGGFVALALAVSGLKRAGLIQGWPLTGEVAAVSAGIVSGRCLLDLNYEEDSSAEVDMNVVMTGKGHFVEIQGTAEHRPFTDRQMAKMVKAAGSGIRRIVQAQRRILRGKA